jgi:hypothetical protein
MTSLSARAVVRMSTKKSAAAMVRAPPAPTAVISAPSASIAAG